MEILRQIVAQVGYHRNDYRILYISFLWQAIDSTMMIICFLLMQMWRWDRAGRICSGDLSDDCTSYNSDKYLV
jgi:hypothetical protein